MSLPLNVLWLFIKWIMTIYTTDLPVHYQSVGPLEISGLTWKGLLIWKEILCRCVSQGTWGGAITSVTKWVLNAIKHIFMGQRGRIHKYGCRGEGGRKKQEGWRNAARSQGIPENQLDSLISFLQLPKLQKTTFLLVSYQTTDNCEQT